MSSLKTILALEPTTLFPAHGPHITTSEKCEAHIKTYIKHRQDREDQIIEILTAARADPSSIAQKLVALLDQMAIKADAEEKYNHEVLPGKHPWSPSEETVKKRQTQRVQLADTVKDKLGNTAVVPLSLLCRLIYNTDNERLIWASEKSVRAHLVKLEQEGKVTKESVDLPKIIEGKITESEVQDGWSWVELHDGKEKRDESVDVVVAV